MDTNDQLKGDSGVSLIDLLKIIKINWMIILIVTFLATAASVIFVLLFVTPKYRSSSEVLIQVTLTSTNGEQVNYSDTQKLIETASKFVVTDNIINKVRESNFIKGDDQEKLSSMTNNDVKKSIKVTSSVTSFIITISFDSSDKYFSSNMTDALTKTLIDTDVDMFKGKFVELSSASYPENITSSKTLYVIVGIIAGVILSLVIIFIKELFNNGYMNKEQLEVGTGIQVMGVIPEFEIKERK